MKDKKIVIGTFYKLFTNIGGPAKYSYYLFSELYKLFLQNKISFKPYVSFDLKIYKEPQKIPKYVSYPNFEKKIKSSVYKNFILIPGFIPLYYWIREKKNKFAFQVVYNKHIQSLGIDLFHANDARIGYLLPQFLPIIYTHHGRGSPYYDMKSIFPNLPSYLRKYFDKELIITLKKARCIIFPSNESMQRLISQYPDLFQKKECRVIYTGIPDVGKLSIKRNNNKNSEEIIMLNIADHLPQKNILLALLIFSKVLNAIKNIKSNIKLKFINCGNYGPHTTRLIEYINESGIKDNIEFTGRISQDQLYNYFTNSDIFIHTPVSGAFDLVILEAMSFRLPILASNIESHKEMLGENNFLLFEDVEEIVKKCILIIENKNIRKEIGNQNRERFLKLFTLERMAERYCEIYQEYLYEKD